MAESDTDLIDERGTDEGAVICQICFDEMVEGSKREFAVFARADFVLSAL